MVQVAICSIYLIVVAFIFYCFGSYLILLSFVLSPPIGGDNTNETPAREEHGQGQ
jgi:hypothetical protein